jgi:hypothetical protein
MKKRVMNLTAIHVARLLVERVAPALLPAERRAYLKAAYGIIRKLIEACKRQAGREWVRRAKPSMN